MHRLSSLRAGVVLGAAALVVALLPVNASAASPRRGAGFQGTSSQKAGALSLPVDLRVATNGRSVTRFDIQWSSRCTAPGGRGSLGGLSVTLNKAVSRLGSFGDDASFTREFGGGTKGVFTVRLRGRFTRRTSATGTFRVSVSIRNAGNAQIDTCDSGNITWRARD